MPKNLANSNISFYAIDLDNGKILADYNGEKIATPASVTKIITSATALEVFGGDKTFDTKLLYSGKISNGTLIGNLYILGSGDPSFASSNFKDDKNKAFKFYKDAMLKHKIKNIKGNIIVIDDLFGYDGVPNKWLLEDLNSNYGQGIYGISYLDNLFQIKIKSDLKSSKIVKISPKIDGVKFINNLKISKNGKTNIVVRALPFENKKTLVGEIAKNREIFIKTTIPDPGLFLGKSFKSFLKENKINVSGKVLTSRNMKYNLKNTHEIASYKSKTLAEIINVLLINSDNHYTEHLYELLKLKGIDINKFWEEKGIDTKSLVLYDGSGLSRADYMNAKILVDILKYMYYENHDYINLLPIAGKQGTVSDILKDFDGIGNIKSGSMSKIQCYAGYLDKDDRNIAFAILINGWNGKRKEVKTEIEHLIYNLF